MSGVQPRDLMSGVQPRDLMSGVQPRDLMSQVKPYVRSASRDIMSVSGHRSEMSIKNYSRTSEMQKRNMSHTLSSIHSSTSSSTERNENDPGPSHIAADEEDPNFNLLTDSQLEQIMNDMPDSVDVLDDIVNIIGNPPQRQRQPPRHATNMRVP